MSHEQKLILEMVKDGKITVGEAEKLLSQTHAKDPIKVNKSFSKKFLKVWVREADKTKVNISIPLALAEVGLKLIPKDKLKIKGTAIDMQEILELIKDGSEGELINIDSTNDGDSVQVKVFVG
jgi:hypothetical protein